MTLWLYRQILILKGIRALSLTDESVFCTEESIMLLVHTENNLCILCTALTTFKAISLFKDIFDNKHWQEFVIRSFRMWQIKGRLCHLCCSSTYLSVMLSHVERITIFIQMRCDTYAVHRIVCVRKRHYKWRGTCLPEFLLKFTKFNMIRDSSSRRASLHGFRRVLEMKHCSSIRDFTHWKYWKLLNTGTLFFPANSSICKVSVVHRVYLIEILPLQGDGSPPLNTSNCPCGVLGATILQCEPATPNAPVAFELACAVHPSISP